jgi:hypothetical protein
VEDALEPELVIARVVAGCLRFNFDGRSFLVRQPRRLRRYKAQQVYFEACQEGGTEGLLTDDEIVLMMRSQGLWSDDDDKAVKTLRKDVEELKVGLFKSFFKSRDREATRTALHIARSELDRLLIRKNSYSHMGTTGYAQVARTRYLVGSGLLDDKGKRVWKGDDFYRQDSVLLDAAVEAYSEAQVADVTMRAVARSDSWQMVWNTRKVCPDVFGCSAADLTDEQRHLVSWSLLYESLQEHPSPPGDELIRDDDAFDGWLIIQRRERERQRREATAETALSGLKLPDSGEIFLVAETDEDLQNIEALNGPQAQAIKKERLAYIANKGEVEEQHMPDSRREIHMMANRATPGK